jgi:hypothetical protein
MKKTAQDANLPPVGYCGSLLFDEMSIQASLNFQSAMTYI